MSMDKNEYNRMMTGASDDVAGDSDVEMAYSPRTAGSSQDHLGGHRGARGYEGYCPTPSEPPPRPPAGPADGPAPAARPPPQPRATTAKCGQLLAKEVAQKMGLHQSVVSGVLQELPEALTKVLHANGGRATIPNLLSVCMVEQPAGASNKDEAKLIKAAAKAMKVHSDHIRISKPESILKTQWVKKTMKTKDVSPNVIILPDGEITPGMNIAPCPPRSRVVLPLQSPSDSPSSVMGDTDAPSGTSTSSAASAVDSS